MKSASLNMNVGSADKEGTSAMYQKSFMAMADEEAKANVNGIRWRAIRVRNCQERSSRQSCT